MSQILLCLAMVGLIAGPFADQGSRRRPPDDPLAAKARAKARFAAVHTDPADRQRELAAMAAAEFVGRHREFLAGRGSLDIFWGSYWRMVESQLALCHGPEETRAVLEQAWRIADADVRILRRRYENGRVPFKEWAESAAEEITVARRLLDHQRAHPAIVADRRARSLPALPKLFAVVDRFSKDHAKARFARSTAGAVELDREKADLLHDALNSRIREFLAGRGSIDIDLHVSARAAAAIRALGDPATAAEQEWLCDLVIEVIAEVGHRNGRFSVQEWLQTREARLRAQLELRRLGEFAPPQSVWMDLWKRFRWNEENLSRQAYARLRAEAAATEEARVRAELLAAADGQLRARDHEFWAGRGSLDILLDSARRWRDAALARAATPAERDRIREAYWRHLFAWDAEAKRRYEEGRFTIQESLEVHFDRLLAEADLPPGAG
jgi:hypothetical protein